MAIKLEDNDNYTVSMMYFKESENVSTQDYPRWLYYPRWVEHEKWVDTLVDIFKKKRSKIDSSSVQGTSDEILSVIRSDLESVGFVVEGGTSSPVIKRPVHFGEQGKPDREYQIDSYQPEKKIGLEVEAGRSTRGNAIYKDIIQTSLLVGVDYFALAVPLTYSFESKGKTITDQTYVMCKTIFDAIYSSERFRLPLKGVLLIGY